MFDVIIIGAGVIGCAVAREMARWRLKIAVLEATNDVAMGSSKANSGIVHAGHDTIPGSLKARFNLAGNPMFDQWSRELDFPFRRNGSILLCFDEKDLPHLREIYSRGQQNRVQGLEMLSREQLCALEPNIGESAVAGLRSPQGGICCPYEMTIALAENAAANGVNFFLETPVTGLRRENGRLALRTPAREFGARIVVNAAGVHADEINNMLSSFKMEIIARAGQYILFDKKVGGLVGHTLFQLPTAMGKGVLVTPTVDGNLLLGPTAVDLPDKHDVSTSYAQYEALLDRAALSLHRLPLREMITSFTGLRAHNRHNDDFTIGWSQDAPQLFNVAGIESPGLSSAPAIAEHVAEEVGRKLRAEINCAFVPVRRGIKKFREMSFSEQKAIVAENPLYGRILCRCENVTEAEVLAAIRAYPGARDLDGIKRRTRSGMGRCQGGFCSARIVEILAQELAMPITQVTKCGGSSKILLGRNKEIV